MGLVEVAAVTRFTSSPVRTVLGREEQDAARRVDQGAGVRDAGLDHRQGGKAALFLHGDDYAFGEMDEAGKGNIADFAAHVTPRCSFEFMPVEGRVYFMRKVDAGP
jgi:hypothetical protein